MNRLHGKQALITGAARGIGEGIARAFAAEGAYVYLTDINDALGAQVAASIGAQAEYRHLDVREESGWQRATPPQLDILVNNAGITGFENGLTAHDPENASLDAWREVHRTNTDGTFLGCKYAIRAMKAQGTGSIINLSSRSGVVGIPAASAYAASKAAIRNHTKSVALYCAGQGWKIRCNSLHPAAILTPMWEAVLGDGPDREERMRGFLRDCPLGRFGTPQEVAAVAVMLAADESAYITGAEFTIDGGILAGSFVQP